MARGKNHSPGDRGARAVGQHRCQLSLVLLGILLCSGCGYRFSAGTGRLPDGRREIAIQQAKNLTGEASAGAWLVAALRREASRAGLTVGASSPSRLLSRVESIRAVPRGVSMQTGAFAAREQEVVVRVALELKLASGENFDLALSDRESYLSAPDLRGTEANRQLALRRVLERLAREGIDRLTRRF